MSTASGPDRGIRRRKADHMQVCADPLRHPIEDRRGAGFREIAFIHDALSGLCADGLDTSCRFLGYDISFPFFVSCMTGGQRRGRSLNRELARAAATARVPVGLGSLRVVFRHPETMADFQVKDLAPDVPVLANIGAVQVRDLPVDRLVAAVRESGCDALAVHLNPGQELMQDDGDRDFRGIFEGLRRLAGEAPFPVIVKETGFGIRPRRVRELLAAGVAFVDLAGAGGTNWMLVEDHRRRVAMPAAAFADWGLPTAVLLAATGSCDGRVLASGGLRSGVDLAKAIALGAALGGMALPFAAAVLSGGSEAVGARIERVRAEFRAALLLSGCASPAALAQVPLLRSAAFREQVAELAVAEGG